MNIHNFFKGDQRTVKAKKNILASMCLKGIDGAVYLLLVPVTLGYLNPYEYGIWLTLNSILMWINSFDIGLGNGMRNKLAEAIAKNDRELGRIYVSTTFFMLIALMGALIVVCSILEPFVDWYSILNTSVDRVPHLDEIVYVAFAIFCLNFIFKFIGSVYLAMQLPAVNNSMVVSGHFISLLTIYILTLTSSGNLFLVATVYSASPLLVYLIAYPITFKKIFPYLSPSIYCFKKEYLKSLFNIGIQFFLLQLSGILLFALTNLLISHLFGPEEVTPYNISYRYFSLMPLCMNLILGPIWSATTDAYVKGEINWIKNARKKVQKILIIASVGIVLMVCLSELFYRLWIGTEVKIPLVLSILMGIYVGILIWSYSYSNFLNGFGKLRLQTINTVIVGILFLPLGYVFGRMWSVYGILISMCLLNISGLVINSIQYNKIINNKAHGIWAK